MGDPLDEVAYLARSANRVAILRAVDERPCDRRQLEAETGVSRSTLSRVLRELSEERDWICRTDAGYTTTTAGSLVINRFLPLLETVGGLRTLDEALEYLPVEDMSLAIRHFHDATLVTPTELDPTAPFDYGIERMRESTTLRSIGQTVPRPYVRALQTDVAAGDLDVELVIGSSYLESISQSPLADKWREIIATERVYRHEEGIAYNLLVLDERVHLWLCSDEGEQAGLLESNNPAVREWAISTIERTREAATLLAPEAVALPSAD